MSDQEQGTCPKCKAPVDKGAMGCEACGHMLVAMSNQEIIGKTIGNLELVSKIARGGMGTVYRAEHTTLRTPYAVKILHARFSTDATTAERFRREAITCSQLRHPNVVFVTDFGFHDEMGLYIIMEFVEGDSLARLLKKSQERLSLARACRILEQCCDALQAAHELGIVHRDLKPDNIMVIPNSGRGDFVKVLDFGIAQIQQGAAEEGPQLTRAGLVLGTPAYIAPEQINGQAAKVGPEADIYALGVILYELITGRPPFCEGSDFEILSKHMFQVPDPISKAREDLKGTRLEALVQSMLAKKPEDRPNSMGALRQLLGESLQQLREKGVQDAVYLLPSGEMPAIRVDTGALSLTPAPVRVTGLIQHIKTHAPDSAVAQLLAAMPGVVSLREQLFHLALWGVLQRELLDQPVAEPRFQAATEHMHLIVEAALNMQGEDASGMDGLLRSLRDLFRLIQGERPREEALVKALQPVVQHHLFPIDLLPAWAQPQAESNSSSWQSFKSLMTTDIRLFGKRAKEPEPPKPAPARAEAPKSEPPRPAPAPARVEAPKPEPPKPDAAARRRPAGVVEKNNAPARPRWSPGATFEPDVAPEPRRAPAPSGLMGVPQHTPITQEPARAVQYVPAPAGAPAPPVAYAPTPTGPHTLPTGQYAAPPQGYPPQPTYAPTPTGHHAVPTGQYAVPPQGYAPPQGYPPQPGYAPSPTGQHPVPTGQYTVPPQGYPPQPVYAPAAQQPAPTGQYAVPPQGYAPPPPAYPHVAQAPAPTGQFPAPATARPQITPGTPGSPVQPAQHPWTPPPAQPQYGYTPPTAPPAPVAPAQPRALPPEADAGGTNSMSRAMAAFRSHAGPQQAEAPAPLPPPATAQSAPPSSAGQHRVQRQAPRIYGQKKDS